MDIPSQTPQQCLRRSRRARVKAVYYPKQRRFNLMTNNKASRIHQSSSIALTSSSSSVSCPCPLLPSISSDEPSRMTISCWPLVAKPLTVSSSTAFSSSFRDVGTSVRVSAAEDTGSLLDVLATGASFDDTPTSNGCSTARGFFFFFRPFFGLAFGHEQSLLNDSEPDSSDRRASACSEAKHFECGILTPRTGGKISSSWTVTVKQSFVVFSGVCPHFLHPHQSWAGSNQPKTCLNLLCLHPCRVTHIKSSAEGSFGRSGVTTARRSPKIRKIIAFVRS
jgi:hypothetical protein